MRGRSRSDRAVTFAIFTPQAATPHHPPSSGASPPRGSLWLSADNLAGGASPSPTEVEIDPLFVRSRKIVQTRMRAINDRPYRQR